MIVAAVIVTAFKPRSSVFRYKRRDTDLQSHHETFQ
jgi:hypothetical protein